MGIVAVAEGRGPIHRAAMALPRQRRARGVLAAMAPLLLPACCVFSAPPHRGPATAHFDGRSFHNPGSPGHAGAGDLLRWAWEREPPAWPEVQGAQPGPPPPRRVSDGRVRVTFVGHATTLIQQDGLNVLTDPIWSERASPVAFAGPKRVRPPGIRFEDLPPIDVVVVSHNHYDHLDLDTLLRIAGEHPAASFFVGLGSAGLLRAHGVREVRELDWWQQARVGPLAIVSARSQHFSGRGLCDRDRALWTAWVLRGPSGQTYFAGDTGFGDHFREAARRLGPMRLAVLPIGAYLPRWFMAGVHVDPAEAVRAARDLSAGTAVGMHFGTFPLADDGPEQAPRDLARVLAAEADPPRFWVLGFGEGRDVP